MLSSADAIILCVVCSRFIGFVSHHLIIMNVVILLLRYFEILCGIGSKLLGSRDATDRPANGIALILAGPLAVITFLFDDELPLLSSTRYFLLHFHLILNRSMSMILIHVRIIELAELLL